MSQRRGRPREPPIRNASACVLGSEREETVRRELGTFGLSVPLSTNTLDTWPEMSVSCRVTLSVELAGQS